MEKTEMKTITFENHAPIRCNPENIKEKWLGYAHLDFGGRYLRGIIGRDKRFAIWYHFSTPYTDGKSYDRFLGRLSPANAGDPGIYEWLTSKKFKSGDGYDDYNLFPGDEAGKVADWLRELGYGNIEVIE